MRMRLLERAVLQQHAELVAAQARERVAAAHARLQHAGDLLQQLVAGRMAAGVVDHLELVEVEVQQRMSAASDPARALCTRGGRGGSRTRAG